MPPPQAYYCRLDRLQSTKPDINVKDAVWDKTIMRRFSSPLLINISCQLKKILRRKSFLMLYNLSLYFKSICTV